MVAKRVPAGRDQLAPVIRAALGGRHRLRRLTRLPGGSKKGVYRAVLDDESTVIVYVPNGSTCSWRFGSAGSTGFSAGPASTPPG